MFSVAGQELHYFAGGNTAKGYCPLYDSNLAGVHKIITLKGGTIRNRSDIIQLFVELCKKNGHSIEIIHCPLDSGLLEGAICRERKMAVVDYSIRAYVQKDFGTVWEMLDAGRADGEEQEGLEVLYSQVDLMREKAYRTFAEALRIHDEWEAIFIDNMDFDKADELSSELVGRLFKNRSSKGKGRTYHRFLGAATASGAVDYVPNLTESCERRYLIKGRPGSGKSTMLKKIASHAEANGFAVEVYHCGFDPHSIDMVIVRELGFAIFDSTSPHEYFPERDGDSIVDVYDRCIRKGTDEDYEADIMHISGRYRTKMNEATSSLALAKLYSKELETLEEGSGVGYEAAAAKLQACLENA